MNEESSKLYNLERQIAQVRLVLTLLLIVGLGLLTVMNLAAMTVVPPFERVFEEMLGDKAKLPTLSEMFINYSRLGGGLAPYAVLLLVPGLTGLGLLLGSRTRVIPLLSIAVIAFLALHFVAVFISMYAPLLSIVQSVGDAP